MKSHTLQKTGLIYRCIYVTGNVGDHFLPDCHEGTSWVHYQGTPVDIPTSSASTMRCTCAIIYLLLQNQLQIPGNMLKGPGWQHPLWPQSVGIIVSPCGSKCLKPSTAWKLYCLFALKEHLSSTNICINHTLHQISQEERARAFARP